MKAKTIQAFAGDSIKLQVAVYDDRGQAFDLEKNRIEEVRFMVPRLDIYERGEMKWNVASFTVPSNITQPGNYPYHVLLLGGDLQFTVAYGILQVMSVVK
jgi:hypothetical protein